VIESWGPPGCCEDHKLVWDQLIDTLAALLESECLSEAARTSPQVVAARELIRRLREETDVSPEALN